MPPWVASAPRLSNRLHGHALKRLTPPSSHYRNAPAATSRLPHLRVRSASTQVSPTAINLRPNIPSRNKELHDALSALSGVVDSYGSRDRLQLALKGLAEQDAAVRVAVLGLNGQLNAQRLARLLLADPLGSEERWEKELEKSRDERAVLLKYGDPADAQPPNPLFKTLAIPSRVLRSHNLEILVSTLNVNATHEVTPTADSSEESILVPKLQAPTARALPVPFPVHKTLILGEGLDSAIALGRFTSDIGDLPPAAKLAVDLPVPSDEGVAETTSGSAAVNIDAGTQAVGVFRDSIKNSVAYERGWFKSGLPTLSQWLVQDLQPAQPIKPVLQSLVTSVADGIEADLQKEETQRVQALASIPTVQQASSSISSHLSTWAEKSHAELRDELDEAFANRNWHKLAWWKLIWRVDDVTMISSEILERRWLTSAEKSSIYLAGRMNQAGFPDDIQSLAPTHEPEVMTKEPAPTAENLRLDLSTDVRKSQPWYEFISSARAELINDTVPALQALAQRLLLQTFSTTSLSSAASAMLYVSVSSFSLFEASAVGVLGLTFSLRRMQKMWEGSRESWEATVREQGRSTLKRTEDLVSGIIRAKEREQVGLIGDDEETVKRRREAREAVSRVRRALEDLEKKRHDVR